jgi:hypothetical protein
MRRPETIAFSLLLSVFFWGNTRGENADSYGPPPADEIRFTPPTVRVIRTETPPKIDGVPDDPCWENAPESTPPGFFSRPVHFRVARDKTALYVLARFPAPDPGTTWLPWEWDEERRVYAPGSGSEHRLTLLWNSEHRPDFIDVWVWRSARTHPVGRVDEGFVDLNQPAEAAGPFSQDAGIRCWHSRYPGRFVGETVPRFRFANPTESCADVKAGATWENGFWTVELTRPLRARHRDDVDFTEISLIGLKIFAREPDSSDWFGSEGCVFLEEAPVLLQGGGAP